MLTPKAVIEKLNEQIAHEFQAAHNYMAMACRFDNLGLKVLSEWFFRQGEEEREHGKRILKYLLDIGAEVALAPVPAPVGNLTDPVTIVQTALHQEEKVTQQIHDLVALAEQHKDYATRSFLSWFVDEQVEEVATMTELLQMLKLAGEHHLLQVEARVAKMLLATPAPKTA